MTEAPAPRLYSIAPHLPFADRLAAGLLAKAGPDPLALARIRILVPHRRAARALAEAFLRQGNGRAVILPRITAIGDVEEDALTLRDALEAELALPPAISPTRRRLLLMRLVLPFLKTEGGGGPLAPALAADLARLIDDFHREGIRLEDLKKAVPGGLAEHWQKTLDFLAIAFTAWPAILEEEGALDPTDRRNRLILAQAERWRQAPPDYPVIAAGSTGSLPATAALLSVVARLPQGMVVLPGLDGGMDAESWAALDPTHPQFGMKQLLDRMRADKSDVAAWPGTEDLKGAARTALLFEAMRPAETAPLWRHYEAPAETFRGLTRLDLEDGAGEAETIALILREALETPTRTAALVTPDRGLARRVIAAMRRWGVTVNDSAGLPLAETPIGSLLIFIAELTLLDWTPARLLSLLKHPLTALCLTTAQCRALARQLELAALRGPRPAPGIAGLNAALPPDDKDLPPFLARIGEALAPLSLPPATTLADLVAAHIAAAERLAASDKEEGAARLWRGEAGEAAAALLTDLMESGRDIPLSADIYPALLRQALGEAVLRPRYGLHPRLFIWSPMEARLQRADVTVLGGLNEDTWPADAPPSAWLSRPMQRQLGLPLPERQIGLSAHDFLSAAAGGEVYLTRALKAGGVPTVPSRWLLRLQALTGRGAEDDASWRRRREALTLPRHFALPQPPSPRPPVAARPVKLSVTDIERWMCDPYALYARRILSLRKLDPIDAEIGAAERGTLIHGVLDAFVKEGLDSAQWQENRLLALAEEAFAREQAQPVIRALWRPRFRRLAPWLVATLQAGLRQGRRPLLLEERKASTIDIDGQPFTLVARADRLDAGPEGTVIVDYKTGAVPHEKKIKAGYAPQLSLEGLMAEIGAFGGASGPVAGLEYWAIRGYGEPGEITPIKDHAARIAEAAQGLTALIRRFRDPETPYLSQPAPEAALYHEYDHLARVGEWREGGGE